ncbi:MAG: hypothetical protein M1829_001349 [Trizodia sp. TS-e1964]|nr:MAG: hypothetical protein M1829_001349 [Trizodia sp. TS-e1964]
MDIEDVFPEDPFEPSVKYASVNQTPFVVPWAEGRRVQLGAGFNTQRLPDDALFLTRYAFRDTPGTPLEYRQCQSTSIKDESGSDIATSAENTSFSISASVGSSFLGASGRGNYEKSVRDNKNTSSISVRAEHTCGQIDAVVQAKLERQAVRLLETSPDPIKDFRQTYGDFYVAGYRVGAVNSTTILGQLANKRFFEAKHAELDTIILLATVHKSINEVSKSANDVGALSVSALDSLTAFYCNFTARTFEDSLRAGEVAAANKQRAMNIAARAEALLGQEFLLGHGDNVDQEAVHRLCDRGLVTELLLAPFASLREYQSLLLRRVHKRASVY